VAFVRYLDCVLVVLTAPFVIVAGLPVLGYVVAAVAWLLSRAIAVLVERQAKLRGQDDLRAAVGLNVAGMIGRAWLVAMAIVAVGLAGEREDGAMAAALVLCAFTIYFAMSLLTRSSERKPTHQ
jgi:hypothetical protein